MRMARRVDEHHAVLVEQPAVAFDHDRELAAVFSAGPMPCPVSRYQAPFSLAMSMPASFQISSSAKCVPLRSPRETNGACASLILRNAAATSFVPATRAG